MSGAAPEVVEVVDVPDEGRYEVRVSGALAGFARYVRRAARTFFVHTEVDQTREGQGLGTRLVEEALRAERERGAKVVPLCPFVRNFIDRHAEHTDLVDVELLALIDGA